MKQKRHAKTESTRGLSKKLTFSFQAATAERSYVCLPDTFSRRVEKGSSHVDMIQRDNG